jgi:surface polysaccharide O-acyltransferase-like enzyme
MRLSLFNRAVTPKDYSVHVDLIRVVALIGVVGIHVLTSITARPDFFGGTLWWLCFLIMAALRASVPLFIMLSGYLVLLKPVSLSDNARKIWWRLGLPFLFFYLLNHIYAWWISTQVPERTYDATSLLHNLNKNSESYLYFLVILIMLYAVRPILRLLFVQGDQKLIRYSIGFFFALAIPAMIARYTSLREGVAFNTYTFWVLWVGYFLYGAWVKENIGKVKKWRGWSILAVVVGYFTTLALSYLFWFQHWQGNDAFFVGGVSYGEEYLSVGVILLSIGLFHLGITLPQVSLNTVPGLKRVLHWLAPLCFGVYLIHPFVIDVLHLYGGIYADNPSLNLPLYVFLNATLTLSISILLSWIISRLPVVRKVIGL